MAQRQEKDKAMTEVLAELSASETAKQFGIVFVPEDSVPAKPKTKDTDPERWTAVKAILENDSRAHGQWAMIKEYDKAGSAQAKAAAINADNNKLFKASEGWEARYEVIEKKTENVDGKSKLYIRYTPVVKEAAKK